MHTQLPDGGILVFVTGQQEVRSLVRRLRRAFPFSGEAWGGEEEAGGGRRGRRHSALRLPAINLDSYPLQAVECDDGELIELALGPSVPCNHYMYTGLIIV